MTLWKSKRYLLLLLVSLPFLMGQAVDQHRSGLYVATEAGATCSQATLSAATTIAASRNIPVWVPTVDRSKTGCTWSITSNFTPSVPLVIPEGTMINVASGVTLTLNACPYAGTYRIFGEADGDPIAGTVLLPRCNPIQTAWWGDDPTGTDDSAPAINAALAAGTNKHVVLGSGTFTISSSIEPPTGIGSTSQWILQGAGRDQTVIQRAAGFTGIMIALGEVGVAGSLRSKIKNLTLDGLDRATGTVGIRAWIANRPIIEDVLFKRLDHAYWASGGTEHTLTDLYFDSNNYGLEIDNTGDNPFSTGSMRGSRFVNNRVRDISFDGTVGASGLVRSFIFYNSVVDGNDASIATPGIAVYLRQVRNIHFMGGHFEGRETHLDLGGGNTSVPLSEISFTGINFGGEHDNAANTTLGVINGAGTFDGTDIAFYHCTFSEGVYDFNQTVKIPIHGRKDLLTSNVTFNGNYVEKFYSTQDGSIETARLDDTDAAWAIDQIIKFEGAQQVTYRHYIVTDTTINATPLTIFTITTAADKIYRVDARFTAAQETAGQFATYSLVAAAENNNGTVTLPTPQATHTAIETDAPWDAAISNSGLDLNFVVTGDASNDVYWVLVLDVTIIDAGAP